MADPVHAPLYSARLSPHRSLTRRQARSILAATAVFTTLASIPFFLLGAWPVVGFLGLDVAALGLAFAASFRAARAYEEIEVTPLELSLAKVSAAGKRREWRFNPVWVHVRRQDHAEYGLTRLTLAFRRQEVEIADFLGPVQREAVAIRLTRALAEARQGPRFD